MFTWHSILSFVCETQGQAVLRAVISSLLTRKKVLNAAIRGSCSGSGTGSGSGGAGGSGSFLNIIIFACCVMLKKGTGHTDTV